jgi:acyl-CoA synthetase (AMP-forming)/AMP-acid ligase II
VVPWCLEHGVTLPGLRRVLIAGAPVPTHLLEGFQRLLVGEADVHTPYGATESLPVSSISGREVLSELRELAESGSGTCVGKPAAHMRVELIAISDEPISEWSEGLALPPGQLGELVVKGPVVTAEYKFQPEPTAAAKLQEGESWWHRMGDVGYRDAEGRLWFCGRKAHRLETEEGLLMPVPIENLFNTHPDVHRTALVGVGARGAERPVLVVEAASARPVKTRAEQQRFAEELRAHTAHLPPAARVTDVLFHPSFPVDVRHNAKIHREELKLWAEERLA